MVCSSMISTYAIIIYCSYIINTYLKKRMKSAQSMRIHKQLFRSLIYQSFVPLFTAYYPAGTAVLLPVFGITVPFISIIVPPACATHPLFDPLLLILTITEYRHTFFGLTGFSRLTRLWTSHSIESTTSHFNRSSVASLT
ncbi:hypothetical protein PENTCL1PPCAC_9204 [Pristionchus entomophagus]|uniref:G protein-coupled receptor n=1 Tax=Pristionchus entomophagus TaxID=358040 RepID=A0AAV5T0C1_9BILA|nr:hypothetical protein PENTCL1PPCAC_9204 [Pristionchus entomophagus]